MLFLSDALTNRQIFLSGWAHLGGLAPGRHSCKETTQRWQAAGNGVFDLTEPEIEPQTPSTDSNAFNHYTNKQVILTKVERILQWSLF